MGTRSRDVLYRINFKRYGTMAQLLLTEICSRMSQRQIFLWGALVRAQERTYQASLSLFEKCDDRHPLPFGELGKGWHSGARKL